MSACPFCQAALDHTLDDDIYHFVYACETVLDRNSNLAYTPHGLDGPLRHVPAEEVTEKDEESWKDTTR